MSRADWNRRQMSNYLQLKNLCCQGLEFLCHAPWVARSSQPRADRFNPFGIISDCLTHTNTTPNCGLHSTENSEELRRV